MGLYSDTEAKEKIQVSVTKEMKKAIEHYRVKLGDLYQVHFTTQDALKRMSYAELQKAGYTFVAGRGFYFNEEKFREYYKMKHDEPHTITVKPEGFDGLLGEE